MDSSALFDFDRYQFSVESFTSFSAVRDMPGSKRSNRKNDDQPSNKRMQSDAELPPIKRTPQPNEESENAEIHEAQENLAIHE